MIRSARVRCCWLSGLLLAGSLLIPALARAEGDRPAIKALRPGFAGLYKQGFWSPFELTIVGGAEAAVAQVELELKDGDGVNTRVPPPDDRLAQLAPGQESRVVLYAKPGAPLDAPVKARLAVSGQEMIEAEFDPAAGDFPAPLDAMQPLLLDLGGSIDIGARELESPLRAPAIAHLASVDELATRWYGYEGVDAIVIFTSRPELLRPLTPASARWQALDAWVRQGGRLVICVGHAADEALAPGGPLEGFAPGRLAGRLTLPQTTAWETYAEATEPLALSPEGGAKKARLDAPRLEEVRGVVEAYEGARPGDLPLVVRTPRGFGEVVFVAADLDRPPFSRWAGSRALWDKLLRRAKPSEDQQTNQGRVAWIGYDDLAGQLRAGLDQFAGVSVPFALVVLLIVIYIACVGPLDYFFLKRFVGRMEWTWFTFPAIVMAFSLGAYLLARHLKGEDARLNQIDLVDVDVSSGMVRGDVWSILFSPQTERYDLSITTMLPRAEPAPEPDATDKPVSPGAAARSPTSDGDAPPAKAATASQLEAAPAEVLLSWFGLPGRGYGGLARPTPASGLFEGAYRFGPELATLDGLPISVWSTKALTARWTTSRPDLMSARLRDPGDQLLKGEIENASELELTEAVVLYDRWAYPVRAVTGHQKLRFDDRSDPQAIETYFNHTSLNEGVKVAQAYLSESRDVPAIMNMVMFHESLGGSRYSQLSHAYLGATDATTQLRNGRALLLGRAAESPTRLLRDGKPLAGPKDQHWTYYRFVFPVDKERR